MVDKFKPSPRVRNKLWASLFKKRILNLNDIYIYNYSLEKDCVEYICNNTEEGIITKLNDFELMKLELS